MEIEPPYAHMIVPSVDRPGAPPISGVPAQIHIPVGAGTQGMGVRTPNAAAVADATVGFDMDWHMPQGTMLVTGTASLMVSAGAPPIITGEAPISEPGLRPKVQVMTPPVTTGNANFYSLL